jgi:DNA polymerase-3 subunit delta
MSSPEPLRPVFLICGSDRPKVERAVARLRRRVTDEAGSDLTITTFDASLQGPEQVLEAAVTPSLALGTRLLLVRNAHAWKVKQRQQLLPYVADPMPGTCLALEAESFGKEDALSKAIDRAGTVLRFDVPRPKELPAWAAKRAQAHGLLMRRDAAEHLVAFVGDEPRRLDRELEKLAAYCGVRPGGRAEATTADIYAVCSPDDSAIVWDLMDAVGLRRRERAFGLLEAVFANGDTRDDANGVLYKLRQHLELLDAATQLQHDDPATAARDLKIHAFRAKKIMQQRRHYDRRRVSRAFRALAEAEAGMRGRAPASLESSGGVNHGDRLVLELALARLLADG